MKGVEWVRKGEKVGTDGEGGVGGKGGHNVKYERCDMYGEQR